VEDLDDCAAMWADPIVVHHIGGVPLSRESVWAKIHRHTGHWALLGFGCWVIEERATGRFVGEGGFADFRREMTPSYEGTPEAGWVLASWAHGKGLATEAVLAMSAWGDRELAVTPTVCIIDTANVASIRVATKCGYREVERFSYKGGPMILFRRERPQ